MANTMLAPLASRTSVKPPVEAPTSRQTWFSISIGYCSSAPVSLTPPRDTNGCAGCACRTASAGIVSEGFATGLSLAVTRPASIAAWARARLSNRPRSTSSRSARLRGVVLLSCLVKFSPVDGSAGRSGQLHGFGLEVLAEGFEHLGHDALGVETGARIHRVRRVVIEEHVGQYHR